MLDSMNLPDKKLVTFAVGYKFMKSSKRGVNFPRGFFIISLRKSEL